MFIPCSQVTMHESFSTEECHTTCNIVTHTSHFMRKDFKTSISGWLGLGQKFFEGSIWHELDNNDEGLFAGAHTEQTHDL